MLVTARRYLDVSICSNVVHVTVPIIAANLPALHIGHTLIGVMI